MLDGLTFAEVAIMVLYWVKEALALGAVFSDIIGEINCNFSLQVSLPLPVHYLSLR